MGVVLLLAGSLAVILWGAHLFTAAVEYVGCRMRLTRGAVGSILSAVGTALPESVLPPVAILLGTGHSNEKIGMGAILGAPLMLTTIAMMVIGLALIAFALTGRRNAVAQVNGSTFSRDMTTFLSAYTMTILAAWVSPRLLQLVIAAALLLLYVLYARATIADGGRLEPSDTDGAGLLFGATKPGAVLQIAAALLVIVAGARLFVNAAQLVAETAGVSPFLFSVLVAPIATELPEKFNSVIWIGRGQDTLAVGNITGALVFQATIVPAMGIALTPWRFGAHEMAAAAVALTAAGVMFGGWRLRRELSPPLLLCAGLFYLAFCTYVLS